MMTSGHVTRLADGARQAMGGVPLTEMRREMLDAQALALLDEGPTPWGSTATIADLGVARFDITGVGPYAGRSLSAATTAARNLRASDDWHALEPWFGALLGTADAMRGAQIGAIELPTTLDGAHMLISRNTMLRMVRAQPHALQAPGFRSNVIESSEPVVEMLQGQYTPAGTMYLSPYFVSMAQDGLTNPHVGYEAARLLSHEAGHSRGGVARLADLPSLVSYAEEGFDELYTRPFAPQLARAAGAPFERPPTGAWNPTDEFYAADESEMARILRTAGIDPSDHSQVVALADRHSDEPMVGMFEELVQRAVARGAGEPEELARAWYLSPDEGAERALALQQRAAEELAQGH